MEPIIELRDDLDAREVLEVELQALGAQGKGTEQERERLETSTRALTGWGETPTPPEDSAKVVALQIYLGILATAVLTLKFVYDWPLSVIVPFSLLNYFVLSRAADIPELMGRFEVLRETLGAWARVLACVESSTPRAKLLVSAREQLLAGETDVGAVRERPPQSPPGSHRIPRHRALHPGAGRELATRDGDLRGILSDLYPLSQIAFIRRFFAAVRTSKA